MGNFKGFRSQRDIYRGIIPGPSIPQDNTDKDNALHNTPSPYKGQKVIIKTSGLNQGYPEEVEFAVEDWYDRVTGSSWMNQVGNPAALHYAMRSGLKDKLPLDNEVVYGKTNDGLGHIVHVSEIKDSANVT